MVSYQFLYQSRMFQQRRIIAFSWSQKTGKSKSFRKMKSWNMFFIRGMYYCLKFICSCYIFINCFFGMYFIISNWCMTSIIKSIFFFSCFGWKMWNILFGFFFLFFFNPTGKLLSNYYMSDVIVGGLVPVR